MDTIRNSSIRSLKFFVYAGWMQMNRSIKRINTRQTEPATPRTPDSHFTSVSVNGREVILFTASFTTAAIVVAIILLQVVNQIVH